MQARRSEIPGLIGTDLSALKETYGITGAPETFVLNGDGKIFAWHVGYATGEERLIEAEVRLALGLEPFS